MPSKTFIGVASFLLLITGSAKIWAASGNSKVLNVNDPIFAFKFKYLLLLVGCLEVTVFFLIWYWRSRTLDQCAVRLVAWLSTVIGLYRLALILIGYQEPCHCLGSLTDALHISTRAADSISVFILMYMLLGSYLILLFTRLRRRSTRATTMG